MIIIAATFIGKKSIISTRLSDQIKKKKNISRGEKALKLLFITKTKERKKIRRKQTKEKNVRKSY